MQGGAPGAAGPAADRAFDAIAADAPAVLRQPRREAQTVAVDAAVGDFNRFATDLQRALEKLEMLFDDQLA